MIEIDNSWIELFLVACAGLGLGFLYFGGLWLTIRWTTRSRHPGLLITVSLFVRLAVVGAALYFLAAGHWQRYVAALPGLWLARRLCIRRFAAKQADS